MEIGRLQVVIQAITDQFDSAMARVDSEGKATADSVSKGAKDIGTAFDQAKTPVERFVESQKKAKSSVEDTERAAKKAAAEAAKAAEQQTKSISSAFSSASKADFAGAAKEISSAFEAAGSAGATAAVGVAAVGVAAVAAVAGVIALGVELTKAAFVGSELGGRMVDLSNNTGLATQQLSLYKIAAEQSGSSVETVAHGVELVEKKFEEAASGNEHLNQLFLSLGINAKQAAEDPQKAFDQLFTSIAAINDPVLRVKVATEVAGRSGANLISTFVTLNEGGGELKARMAALGLSLTGDVAAGADRVGDEFAVLSAVSDHLKIEIADKMGPGLVDAMHAIERAVVDIGPTVISLATTFANALTGMVDKARVAASSIKGFFSGFSEGGIYGAIAGAAGAIGQKSAQISVEHAQDAAAAAANKPAATPDQDAIRKALRKAPKKGAANNPITPADTFSSTKQLRDAELSLEEAGARAAIALAKSEADEKRRILDAEYADHLTTIRAYFDERRTLESQSVELQIQEQQRIIALEKQREADAEKDTQAEIARIQRVEQEKRRQAKTPQQKQAITEDESNKILNAENQLQATRDKHAAKRIEAETKIKQLELERQGRIATIGKEEVKANEALEKSFEAVQIELLKATGDEFGAAALEIGKKFSTTLAEAIAEGRPEIVAAIQKLREIDINKAQSAQSEKRLSITQAGLDTEQAKIQNQLNQGIISEVTARRQQIAAQDAVREKMLEELEIERQLAVARGDAVAAARFETEIEKTKGLGKELDPHLKNLNDNLTRDFDQLQATLISGSESITDAFKNFTKSFLTDLLTEVQSSLIEGLTGEKSIGSYLGKFIGGFLGNLFGFGGFGGGAATGGLISGPGGPTSDSVPMMLSNGEYVIKAESVKKIGIKTLDHLNQVGGMMMGGFVGMPPVPAYAGGGLVSAPAPVAAGPVVHNITINVPVHAPAGTVSPRTREQIATETARQLQFALGRNN